MCEHFSCDQQESGICIKVGDGRGGGGGQGGGGEGRREGWGERGVGGGR